MHCEVDVVSWRERRIKARILVDADVEAVWSVLTDYERLADFIPNLVYRCFCISLFLKQKHEFFFFGCGFNHIIYFLGGFGE